MTTTANTLAWLDVVRNTRPGNLTYDDWSELHGMLHDLIHIDDVDALRAVLRDRDLGEAVEVQGWRDIETGPESGLQLCWVKRNESGEVFIVDFGGYHACHPDRAGIEITHWMPTPAAPDAKP